MSLMDLLLHPGMRPFEIAIGVLIGLLLLEIIVNQLGFSLMGEVEADADIDAGVEFDADLDADFDMDAAADLEMDADPEITDGAGGGLLSWLGIGEAPVIIWLAGVLAGFGLFGYLLQIGAISVLGAPLGANLASAIAFIPGLAFGKLIAKAIAKLFPKNLTTAISRRSYGRRRGVITVGTARVGKPAQARFTDGHGNMHYAMVEPFEADDPLSQGTEVFIIRTREGQLKAIRLSD